MHDGDPKTDQEQALEGISVLPGSDEGDGIAASDGVVAGGDTSADPQTPATPEVREGIDADDEPQLKADPTDPDAKLDVGLDETFPSSDAPASTQPGHDQPVPSTGFDEEEERRLAEQRGG